MSSSVGMMKFPIYAKIEFMFQTTNQLSMEIETVINMGHEYSYSPKYQFYLFFFMIHNQLVTGVIIAWPITAKGHNR